MIVNDNIYILIHSCQFTVVQIQKPIKVMEEVRLEKSVKFVILVEN